MDLVGRKYEKETLERLYESKKSEFLAVYGRRRVGKTFLLREFFKYKFDFQISGLAKGNTEQQLLHFHNTLEDFGLVNYEEPAKNWIEAFNRLKKHLELTATARKVILIDEMPWLDTFKSDFITALESFWNSWATNRKDIFLIATGSSASWILNKLINNTEGLHNRITQYIKLYPFTLYETEQFLQAKNIQLSRYQIAELYMVLGGIPYYLDYVKPGQSVAQVIDEIFFNKNAILKNEIKNLYRALFKKYTWHEKIVESLAKKAKGLTRTELIEASGLPSGGTITKILAELEEGGFIVGYKPLYTSSKTTYRLADFYTAFYFRFINGQTQFGENTWTNLIDHPIHRTWQGYTFEQLCMYHIKQIKQGLGISGIQSHESAWQNENAQIDLLIDRRDQVMNIIEMKFSLSEYSITKDYDEKLRRKISQLKENTKTKKSIFLTFITSYGLQKNKYSGIVTNELTLDDLFKES